MSSGGFAFFPQPCRFGTSTSGGAELGCKLLTPPCPTNYALALRCTPGCDVCHCLPLFRSGVCPPKTAKPPAPPRLAALPSSPNTCRFLGQHPLGCRTSSEVMRQTSPSSSPLRSKDAGRLSPTGEHSVCAQGLQMLMGFIHNRQHINRAKECPDRGRLSGHLMRHLSGTKKGTQ
jgi:hypothetical protein